MKVAVFSSKGYDRRYLTAANTDAGELHQFTYIETPLTVQSAVFAAGHDAVCAFVNDCLDVTVLTALAQSGIRLIALRCAGFNNVDLAAANRVRIEVARVPGYSPAAVAEHAVAMMLTLNRHTHRAYARVREGNFALEGLLGFDMQGRTVGVVGTGKIGTALARILKGFGCRLLATDPFPSEECRALGVSYVPLPTLLAESHIVTLHCPLTPDTRHLIDAAAIRQMRHGVMLINTSRGAVVETPAVIAGLKTGAIGYLGLDVYEEESDLFFENLSDQVIQDDVFARLLTFPNVLVTGHQAFFTHEALTAICATTVDNLTHFQTTGRAKHPVSVERIAAAPAA
jgi:D-lactate dehydrogenase